MFTTQALIVGAGPTGMTAAIELRRAGMTVRILDKSMHLARWSQALVLQARTLEQFQRYGIAHSTVSQGRVLTGRGYSVKASRSCTSHMRALKVAIHTRSSASGRD